MIADPRVFDDKFVPPDLLHRENEIEELLRRWTTVYPAETDALVSGPSGVGKSLLTRKAVDRLEQQHGTTSVFVNSLGKTTGGVIRATLEVHPCGPADVPQTLPTGEACQQLREVTDRNGAGETIVVLDEGDDLPETEAISELMAIPDVTVVAIAHDGTNWLSRLDVNDGHPFDQAHITLERYAVDELANILERRARQGLHGDVVSRSQLEAIADEVAGVARKGIQSLRAAAELARERGHHRIRDRDVADAYERARHRIREMNLESLPWHHQVLYAIVHDAGEISGPELHDRYDAVADQLYEGAPVTPIGKRARRNKFEKLEKYDLVNYDGPTRDRLYWVVDGDIEPIVGLPSDLCSKPPNR